jgi:hypothetical protein
MTAVRTGMEHINRAKPDFDRAKKIGLTIIAAIILITVTVPVFSSQTGSRAVLTSPNSCDGSACHPVTVTDIYDEHVNILDQNIPSKILIGTSKTVTTNITINSTTYVPPNVHWRCDLRLTLTSTTGKVSVTGSPKTAFLQYPGFAKEYSFSIKGDILGNDTLKLDANITTGHGGKGVNVSTSVDIEVYRIIINRPPQLLDAKVSPATGDLNTDFTYSVIYQDPDNDLPVNLSLSVDSGPPLNLTPTDGMVDTIRDGELYSTTIKGSDLGLGMHTFRFAANDKKHLAVGDIFSKDGPEVIEVLVPNKRPQVQILSPANGEALSGLYNITGLASDPDTADVIGSVEVKLDNSPWRYATGAEDWYLNYDFTNVFPGRHVIYARASDGKDYSDMKFVEIDVVTEAPLRPSIELLGMEELPNDLKRFNGTTEPPDNNTVVDKVEV